MRNNEPTVKQKVRQTIFTVILSILLFEMLAFIFYSIEENERSDKWMQRDLNEGKYASCMETYHMLYNLAETEDEEYVRFEEFTRFYEQYILCVEYYDSAEYLKEPAYKIQAKEYRDKMVQISDAGKFPENQPHYEYLLSTFDFE